MVKSINNSFILIFCVLFLSSFQLINNLANENCFHIQDRFTRYDLYELSKKEAQIIDKEIDTMKIKYKLCKNVEGSSSIIAETTNGKLSLAGSVNGKPDSKNTITVFKNETIEIVTMNLSEGDKCEVDPSRNYKFKIELTCNKAVEYEKKDFIYDYACDFLLKADSKYACGEDDAYINFEGAFAIIIGIVLCVFGNGLGILGYKFLSIAFILSCIITFALLLMIISFIFGIDNEIIFFVLMGLGVVIGIVVSILLLKKKKYVKVYMAIIGGITGFLLGLFFYQYLITLIATSYQKVLYYVVIIIFAGIGVGLGIVYARKICIFGTSVMGGYVFMKGISLFLIGKVDYINEQKVFDFARTGNYEQIEELITPLFYIYPALWIVFIVVYIVIQYKINPSIDECTDYKDLEGKFCETFGNIETESSKDSKMVDDSDE